MASIKERSGSYQITVSCGRDIYGKKLIETTTYTPDPSLTPKKRQKAVEEFARQFEADIKNGIAMDGRKITLKEFTDRWLREYASQKLQEEYGQFLLSRYRLFDKHGNPRKREEDTDGID